MVGQGGILENLGEGGGVAGRILSVDQQARDPIRNDIRQAADRTRHHRQPAGLSLGRHQSKRLRPRWHDKDVGGLVERRQLGVGLGGEAVDSVRDAEVDRRFTHPVQFGVAGRSAGSADDQEMRRDCVDRLELGDGRDRDVRSLERLDAAGKKDDRFRPQAEPLSGFVAIAGVETR